MERESSSRVVCPINGAHLLVRDPKDGIVCVECGVSIDGLQQLIAQAHQPVRLRRSA